MKWKNQITDLEAYKPGKTIDEVKKRFGLDSIVKLASNENPFGYSPKVDALLEQFDGSYTLYPDGYATYLREEVAAFLNVDEKQLIFTNKKTRSLIASRLFICYAAAFRCHSANKRLYVHSLIAASSATTIISLNVV